MPRRKNAFRLTNTPAGHSKLLAILPPGAHVILEATACFAQAELWP